MSIVVGGQIIGDPTTYMPWDPSLLSNPAAATQDSRGCLPGYACIYVEDGLTGGTVKVCRLLDASVLGPGAAAVIQEESGPNVWDASMMSIASAAESVVGGVAAVGSILPSMSSTTLLLVAAALALFMWKK